MSFTDTNYNQLIFKLDEFIRKFYLNKIIRGVLYSTGLVLGLFLLFNFLEYQFYFSTGVRKFFFYSFLMVSAGGTGVWVMDPLIRYFRLGHTISHEQAAGIIGSHFSDVKDRLLNILQLKKLESQSENAALISASIEQKTQSIKLVPFQSAIDLSTNRKYLRYALPPLLLLLIVLWASPGIITDATTRIIQNNKQFEKAAPFSYEVVNEKLSVVQFDDYHLEIQVEGDVRPHEVFVNIDDFQYRMTAQNDGSFSYVFKNVQNDVDFYLSSGTVLSRDYTLQVLKKPNLSFFELELNYPSYIQRPGEKIANTGDLIVPEGTQIVWNIEASETDQLSLLFGDATEPQTADQRGKTQFRYSGKFTEDMSYKMLLSNKNVPYPDSLTYNISVIKDQYPSISVEKLQDSLDKTLVYFIGAASDDYGLGHLTFNYTVTNAKGQQTKTQKIKVDKEEGRDIQFSYVFDIQDVKPEPGDRLEFFFEVFDNDGVNGRKSSKTQMMTYEKPTLEEVKMKEQANDDAIKEELDKALKNMDKLLENMEKLREKLLQAKQLDWKDKKEMEKLLQEQKDLLEQIEKAKEKLRENKENQEEFETLPEELMEKQDKLEELMEKAADPEMQELMEKIQDLMQELEKDDAIQMLEQFQMNNETKQNEMKRMLELFKQLEMEKNIMDQINRLEELAEEQEKLAEDTEKGQKSEEDLKKEQEELNKKMEDLQKKMDELEKDNKKLSPPKNMGEDNQEKMEDAEKDMKKASEEIEQGENKKASKSQKSAAKKMKKQAGAMKSSMESGAAAQASEDIKTIRQLLENLVTISMDQEILFRDLNPGMVNSPLYTESMKEQFKLQNDFKVVEDTLIALSMRNPDIESFVLDKVAEIKYNFKEGISHLEERQVPQAQVAQRRAMKNLNDLSLMMNESLDQAQQASGAPGSGSCNKPGGTGQSGKSGAVPMDKITEGQQGLSEQLQKMKDKMGKEGESGEGKEGKDGKSGKNGLSAKEFAQAAAHQAALRKALQELNNAKKEQGKGSKLLEEIMNNMDKIETDLVNKRLNNETLNRMKDIETRLLEAEKAEKQRELDEKRKSETAMEKRKAIPPALEDYLKKRQQETDMYKTVSPALKPYYKSLVDEYYNSLKATR